MGPHKGHQSPCQTDTPTMVKGACGKPQADYFADKTTKAERLTNLVKVTQLVIGLNSGFLCPELCSVASLQTHVTCVHASALLAATAWGSFLLGPG